MPKQLTINSATHRFLKLAMASLILIFVKWKLGLAPVIAGPELVTSLCVVYALVFKLTDCLFIITIFNFDVGILYGFGTWWIAYWFIWPIEIILTKLMARLVTSHQLVLGIWCGLLTASIWMFYFFSDWFFFSLSFAILNITGALFVNIPGGIITGAIMMLIGTRVVSFFYASHFYSIQDQKITNYRLLRPWFERFPTDVILPLQKQIQFQQK